MQINTRTQVLRMNELHKKVGLSKSMLYALIAEGKFPQGFKLTNNGRSRGWLESSIDEYLAERSSRGDQT